jgi:hypothetical protein
VNTKLKLSLEDLAKDWEVRHGSLAMEIWIRSQVTPCGFCGGENDTGQAFEAFHRVIPQSYGDIIRLALQTRA